MWTIDASATLPSSIDFNVEVLEPRVQLWFCSNCQFARVVKGVDLRSTGVNSAWVQTPQLTLVAFLLTRDACAQRKLLEDAKQKDDTCGI